MHGPTCVFRANLTPFSPQTQDCNAEPCAVEEPNHGVTAIVTQMFDNMVHTVEANRPNSGRYVTYQV